jgi:CxxC-x17-CxxC domain-containing protein
MGKKINLKAEKAKRNLEYALKFKKRKKRARASEPSFAPSSSFGGGGGGTSFGHAAVCATCGVDTTVPFKPTQGRPVLCRGCFQKAA